MAKKVKVRKIRNLINSNSKRISKKNVCWDHIKQFTMEALVQLEYLEEHNDQVRLKKAIRLFDQFEKLNLYMKERLKNELNHLEYLKVNNRERQSRMTEYQLKSLFQNEAIRQLKKDGVPYNEDNLKVQLDHMIQSYHEREAERSGDNEEAKIAIKKRIEEFNPEGLDFDVENPQ